MSDDEKKPEETRPEAPSEEPVPEESRSEKPRRGGASVLRGVGLAVSAVVLLGAGAAAVVVAESVPPGDRATVQVPAVNVPAGPVTQVCAGPAELTAGGGMSIDPELDPQDTEPTTLTKTYTLPRGVAGPAEATYAELDAEPAELSEAGEVRTLEVREPASGGFLEAGPVDDLAALAGGATVTRTNAGDLRGLAAAPCQAPTSTAWLVGGGTDLGQSAELVLTNTGDTPASVTATMWTSLGRADAPQLSEIVIAPRSATSVLLEGVSAGDRALALRIDASGGQIVARVQDQQLDGLVSAGVDLVTRAAPPGLDVTVPGVVLEESDIEEKGSALRLVNPGQETATASVRLLGPDGPVDVPGAEEVVLDPGVVLDLTLAGIEPGAYAVEITSDRPVTGSVVLTRVGQAGEIDPDVPPVERAWTAAAEPSRAGLLHTSTFGDLVDSATVVLTNPGEQDVEVELVPVIAGGEIGDPVRVTVPAGSTVTRDAAELTDGGPAVRLTADGGGLVASTVLTAAADDGELISVLPMTPDPHEQRTVRVDLR
ncbi:DUF5719 family protein [Georgenia halophila]|uniref:DUF5719 family protein n=1 Tax=Georgenia halophila TaxID=620889 RepID=A0ABP8LTK3_9MICO